MGVCSSDANNANNVHHINNANNGKDIRGHIRASSAVSSTNLMNNFNKLQSANISANKKETEIQNLNEFEDQKEYIRKTLNNKSDKTKFTDEEFLPRIESIICDNPNHPSIRKVNNSLLEEFRSYSWKTFDEIFGTKQSKVFLKDHIESEDIKQGALGSCYFLSAICGLVKTNKDRFYNIFEVKEYNTKGIYAVKLFVQGIPKIVIIDDYVPCKMKKNIFIPAFSSSRKKETAILVLEKAWAKLNNKCYMKTWQGTPQEAFSALCEAPCIYEFHKRYLTKNKTDILWEKLLEAQNQNWIMCSNTEEVEVNTVGIQPFHAFTILEIYELEDNNKDDKIHKKITQRDILNDLEKIEKQTVKLIKLRNPTGDSDSFKGEFHKGSKNLTKQLSLTLGMNPKSNFGVFVVTFEEFLNYFPWTFICKYESNYEYNYAKFNIELIKETNENIENNNEFHSQFLDLKENSKEEEEYDSEADELSDEGDLNLPPKAKFGNIQMKHLNLTISLQKINNYEKSVDIENNTMGNNKSFERQETIKTVTLSRRSKKRRSSSPKILNQGLMNLINENISSYKIEPPNKALLKMDDIITSQLVITQKTQCYITLHQPQKRFNEGIIDSKTPLAFIIVACYNSSKYSFVKSEFINWEKLMVECVFLPGEYHIFAKSFWNETNKYELVLSTYAESPCLLYTLEKKDIPVTWLQDILIDIARKNPEKEFIAEDSVSNSFTSNVLFNNNNYSGFAIFHYENNSVKGRLVINLRIKLQEGIKFLNIEQRENYTFIVESKKTLSIFMQIIDLPWICKLEYEQDVWFEYPIEYIVKKNFSSEKVEKKYYEEKGLTIFEIPYERGFVLMIDNLTDNYYRPELQFSKMKHYVVENFAGSKKIFLQINPKSQFFLNIKCTRKKVDQSFKPRYKVNFNLI